MAYQGTFETITNAVIARLHLDATDDVSLVHEWVNLAYLDAVQQTGCLQQTGTANLTDGTSSYDLPSTVAWIKLLTLTYPDGSFSDPMRQVTLEEILQQRRDTSADATQVVRPLFAIVGQNQIEIWPTPGTGQSMTFWYVYLPDELSGTDEPAILEPYGSMLLTYGACVEGARFKKDPLLPDMEAAYQMWLNRFQTWLNRREGLSAATVRVQNGRYYPRFSNPSVDLGV